jgi:hypothetical protein
MPEHPPLCPKCGGKSIVRYGTRRVASAASGANQRYMCNKCGTSFVAVRFRKAMGEPWLIKIAVKQHLKGASLRTIRDDFKRFYGIDVHHETIRSWIAYAERTNAKGDILTTKESRSDIAKRAWKTRRMHVATGKPRGGHNKKSINGKFNPYHYGTRKYERWYYFMKAHGTPPPEEKRGETEVEHTPTLGYSDCPCPNCLKLKGTIDAEKPRYNDPRSRPINGQYNPYNSGKEPQKASRWRYWMQTHGRAPPDKKWTKANTLEKGKNETLSPAQKAWVTRRQNDPKLRVTKSYDNPKKNAFRKIIIKSFRKIGGTCLALESPDFLFVKELPNMKFIIYENNEVQHRKMKDALPLNVLALHFGDIKDAGAPPEGYSCAFLDYCQTFQTMEPDLLAMREKLSSCKKIALTFSLRCATWETKGYYGYELARRLLKIFDNYEIEYGNGYHDSSTMVGLILVRKDYVPNRRVRLGPYKIVSFKMPLETMNKIDGWAAEKDVFSSEIMRRILMDAKEAK